MGEIRIETRERWDWVRLELGRANAIGPEFLALMERALDRLVALGDAPGYRPDAPSRPVLFTGQGSSFSAGLDLPSLLRLDREAMRAFVDTFHRTFHRLAMLPRPTLAVVNGHAVAGGAVLAMACDRRIAAEGSGSGGSYALGLKEAAIGLPLPRIVAAIAESAVPPGPVRAEVMLTGEVFTPQEAHRLGLVDELAPHAELERVAEAAAERFARSTGRAVARLREQLRGDSFDRIALPPGDEEFLDAWFSTETQRRLREIVARIGS